MDRNASVETGTAATDAVERVLAEIDRLRAEKPAWGGQAARLLLSVAAFILVARSAPQLGFFKQPAADLAMLVGVLLFHEFGHFLSMRAFGYRDVRMYLVPFFGGMTTGRSGGVAGWQRAAVALAGPLPGLLLALPGAFLAGLTGWKWPAALAGWLFLINAFNLLPFYGLDGGRLIHEALLCRNRWLELAFRLGSGGALALAGIALFLTGSTMGGVAFAVFGAYVIAGTLSDMEFAAAAGRIRAALGEGASAVPAPEPDGRIPVWAAAPIIAEVVRGNPRLPDLRAVAWRVEAVWERLAARPPGIPAALGLLAVYGLAFAGSIAVVVALAALAKRS